MFAFFFKIQLCAFCNLVSDNQKATCSVVTALHQELLGRNDTVSLSTLCSDKVNLQMKLQTWCWMYSKLVSWDSGTRESILKHFFTESSSRPLFLGQCLFLLFVLCLLLLNIKVEQDLMDFLTHSCEKFKLVVTYAFIFEVLNICWRIDMF